MITNELLERRRLNLGCGLDLRPNYINVDLHARHGPDLVADITDLSTLPAGAFDEIIAFDVLEHLERAKTRPTLKGWARLLAPNGVLHLRVPSIVHMALALCEPRCRQAQEAEKVMHQIFGTQAYDGDYHLAGFTPAILDDMLSEAGLTICYSGLIHGLVYDVKARKARHLTDAAETVHHVYFTELGRPADEGGLSHFTAEIEAGRMTAGEMLYEIRTGEEFLFLQQNPLYLHWHRAFTDRPTS